MKRFAAREFRLARSPVPVKIVYSGYLIFAVIGYLTIVLLGATRVGPDPEAIVAHYRGAEGDEAYARPFGQMLEEAHFHAFIEGVTLLVLAHLFAATSIGPRVKMTVIGLAFVSTLADLASPWLIRYVLPEFALLQIASWVVMTASAVALIVVPFYDMWRRR